jgi:O-antigen ligase
MFWGLDPPSALHQLPTTIAILGLYLASGSFRFTEKEIKAVVLLTIVGGCIAAFWTVHLYYSGNFWTEDNQVSARGSLIAGGRQNNPDLLAMSLLLPISLACGYFFSFKRWLSKSLMLVIMGISILGLLLTLSRGAVIALVVMMLVFLYRLKVGRRMIMPAVLLAILLSLMPSIFFTRFQQAGENGGSGRTDIWKVGWVAFKHYGFLGAGFNNFPFAYAKYAGQAPHYRGTYRAPHNIYVAIAVETGIIGLFLFGGAVRSQLRPAFRFKDQFGNHNLLPATEAAFWGLLVFGFSGNILWEKAFWLAMMLLTIAVNTAQDRQYSQPPQG